MVLRILLVVVCMLAAASVAQAKPKFQQMGGRPAGKHAAKHSGYGPQPKRIHGNNGLGNGIDPQPPGNPPVNDGPGAFPGHPGNKKGRR
jgi:hypothetical protein